MSAALWRRLDRSGHDAAALRPQGDGWLLSGLAVFEHESGPASLAYSVETNGRWIAKGGSVRGFVGTRRVECQMRRERGGWFLDGVEVAGLSHLFDLDFSFTPATNALALRRVSSRIGQRIDLPAAWFDLDERRLTTLPQTYERISETAYRYAARSVGYEAVLVFCADGFVALYPGLWGRVD